MLTVRKEEDYAKGLTWFECTIRDDTTDYVVTDNPCVFGWNIDKMLISVRYDTKDKPTLWIYSFEGRLDDPNFIDALAQHYYAETQVG